MIPPDDGNEIHPVIFFGGSLEGSAQLESVLIEDDDVTVYNKLRPYSFEGSEYFEDDLTDPGTVASEIDTVYHDNNVMLDLNNHVSSVGNKCSIIQPYISVKDQIPMEVAVDFNFNETVEQLCESEEVKKLFNLIKEPLTKLD